MYNLKRVFIEFLAGTLSIKPTHLVSRCFKTACKDPLETNFEFEFGLQLNVK